MPFSLAIQMKEIPLTQGKVALVDDQDFDWLNQWKWCLKSTGYAVRQIGPAGKRKNIYMHRLILGLTLKNQHSDHINGYRLDNQRSNLRSATPAENARNKGMLPTNKSGYKGAYKRKGKEKWVSRINVGKKTIYLGFFNSPQEAHAAYCEGAKKIHGKFANFGDIQ